MNFLKIKTLFTIFIYERSEITPTHILYHNIYGLVCLRGKLDESSVSFLQGFERKVQGKKDKKGKKENS